VCDEGFGNAMSMERGHDQQDVTVCAGTVVSEGKYCEGIAKVLVEET